ncbi:MAG: murein biosynthesis integral membrane protein MurJ [Planctomycetes bacterium]|nr:murein biosynthesis integral membrane protein MurJ [Planctomycetota bacterium]
MSDLRRHFKNTVLIGGLTFFSRILGLVRDVAFAAIFADSMVADAFFFAWRVPNLFRRLFGEGALSSALIPVFTEYLELKSRRAAWKLAWVVATATLGVLLACLLLGEAFIVLLPRVAPLSERWRLTFLLTGLLLPYMVFICLTALAGAILNSLKHFFSPAAAPVLLNLCWIVALVLVAPHVATTMRGKIFVVVGGILVAGVCQLILQVFALVRKGFPLRPAFNLQHPGLRRVVVTMAPIVAGMAAFQLNVLFDGVIAIGLAAPEGVETFTVFGATVAYPLEIGANSVLAYASRLMQFPLGVFGIALATAIFPALSARAAREEWEGFSDTVTHGLGAVLVVGIPAGAGLIILGGPVVELLFEHGRFGNEATVRTVSALIAYAVGIWAYCALHILNRAFYGVQDPHTPVKIAVGAVVVNLALNLTLIWFLGAAGLALSTAISAALQVSLLTFLLHRGVAPLDMGHLVKVLAKTLLATLFMAAVCYIALRFLPAAPVRDKMLIKTIRVLVPIAAGTLAYFFLSLSLGISETRFLLHIIWRRFRR